MGSVSKYTEDEAQFLKNIGFKIQFYRKKAGMSQEQLAEKCGLSYSTISHIESTSSYSLHLSIISYFKCAPSFTSSASYVRLIGLHHNNRPIDYEKVSRTVYKCRQGYFYLTNLPIALN